MDTLGLGRPERALSSVSLIYMMTKDGIASTDWQHGKDGVENVDWQHGRDERAWLEAEKFPSPFKDCSDEDHCKKFIENEGDQRSHRATDIRETPLFVWPVLVVSILVGSSSSSIMKSMDSAAPVSLAGWRHQLSALVMMPGFLWQWCRLPESDRRRALLPVNLGLQVLCALGFASNMAGYFWSLDHTSMTHCLFLIALSPIFVALYTKLLGGELLSGEVVGVSLGLVGAAMLGAGTKAENDNESTHIGDLVAFSSSAVFAVYVTCGRRLRSWMPLFVFQFMISLVAAIILGAAGVLLEGWTESDAGQISGLFGWTRKEYLLGTVLLAVGPGFLGHAGYSMVLRYSSALLLPTGLSVQPLLGSALGWALGYTSVPGLWTCLGGIVTLCGTLCVSYAAEHHKARLENDSGETHYHQPDADKEGKPLLRLQSSELP